MSHLSNVSNLSNPSNFIKSKYYQNLKTLVGPGHQVIINLVLWWKALSIQVIPFQEQQNHLNAFIRWRFKLQTDSHDCIPTLPQTNSSSRRLWSKRGTSSSTFRTSIARTLLACSPNFLMLSKMLPSHAVIGSRQSCIPRNLSINNAFVLTIEFVFEFSLFCMAFNGKAGIDVVKTTGWLPSNSATRIFTK